MLKMMLVKMSVFLLSTARLKAATDRSCRCGERQLSQFGELFSTRVVGGMEAEVNEFPWAALLSIKARDTKPRRCGGSLINDRYVVLWDGRAFSC